MALGKRCSSMKAKRSVLIGKEEEGKSGIGVMKYTRSFGRKRILISSNEEEMVSFVSGETSPTTPLKRLCSEGLFYFEDQSLSPLESLPQDILVRILCGVDHEDLKQLIYVSKTIRDATLIAKKWHFEYSTPRKTLAFRSPIDFDDSSEEFNEIEVPNAPKQLRTSSKSRLGGKNLREISVELFASPRSRRLFAETDE